MDQLEQARAQIDAIDAQMAALFTQRMQAVVQVAQYMHKQNLCLEEFTTEWKEAVAQYEAAGI